MAFSNENLDICSDRVTFSTYQIHFVCFRLDFRRHFWIRVGSSQESKSYTCFVQVAVASFLTKDIFFGELKWNRKV